MSASDPTATITLQNGDAANPSTTFNVADGVLRFPCRFTTASTGTPRGGNYHLHSTALVKTGAGTLALSPSTRYSGVTTISGGFISTDNLAAGGVNSGLGRNASLVLDGGGLQYTGSANVTFNRPISLGATRRHARLDGSPAPSRFRESSPATGALNIQGQDVELSPRTRIRFPPRPL